MTTNHEGAEDPAELHEIPRSASQVERDAEPLHLAAQELRAKGYSVEWTVGAWGGGVAGRHGLGTEAYKMGQPDNAEILAKLVEIADFLNRVSAEAAERRRRGRALDLLHAIEARLENLEAATGIAASKSAERFDALELLLATLIWRVSPKPAKRARKGKKKRV